MTDSYLRKVHRPVLLEETVGMLKVIPGGVYMDGTFGLGGHTKEILKRSAPDGRVVAFDWDEEAIRLGLENIGISRDRLQVVRRNFREIDVGLKEVGIAVVDGILIDIGLSSLQLEAEGRGFSFSRDEPLDMRMDRRRPITAAQVVADSTEEELADIFYYYGDEKQARRIAAAIVKERKQRTIEMTGQLAQIVGTAVPKRFHPNRIHVATKVFQALRIAVNEELANLGEILEKAPNHLKLSGRICIISFHSLEDRIVKRKLAGNPRLSVLTKKPITPDDSEIMSNPRARSSRLRVAERAA
ncbi:MAG: 16S rRNA (cytosine(1402)-N(4))-methyltransferase RsmH [Desulfofustis sp.]|nr:16S rRNA (cytosine(1402)-N(4))-methyltransferase RsmH [Desulfofustis sp.]